MVQYRAVLYWSQPLIVILLAKNAWDSCGPLLLVGRPPTDIFPTSQCCGWTSPHLQDAPQQQPSENFEKMRFLTSPGGYKVSTGP